MSRHKNARFAKKSFKLAHHLKEHIKIIHEKNVRAYKCHICEKDLVSNQGLKRHIEQVHEAIKAFNCDLCDAKFTQTVNLKSHIISVHENVRKHECNICNHSFKLVHQ